MPRLIYPAVLERGAKNTFGAWFPDFAGCVAGGTSPEHAIEKAQRALTQAVYERVEREQPLPKATPFEKIALPKNCELIAFFAITVEPPDPSERVNVYLPRSLIGRADTRASELGMSRSSFFGFALSATLGVSGTGHWPIVLPLSRQKALVAPAAATKPPKKRRRS
ncbi:MAG TPA: type II toxin-antitoxin system HicB family antitoxin [Rhizomicrobium sp.]